MLLITLFKDADQDGTPVHHVQAAAVRALWKLSEYVGGVCEVGVGVWVWVWVRVCV